jgi:coatomer protein complex subunit gamma
MMYLVIKELSDIAEDVIMVTQSLMKDIQAKQETSYRANAIRALCQITDVCPFEFSNNFKHKLSHTNHRYAISALHDPGHRAYLKGCYC